MQIGKRTLQRGKGGMKKGKGRPWPGPQRKPGRGTGRTVVETTSLLRSSLLSVRGHGTGVEQAIDFGG